MGDGTDVVSAGDRAVTQPADRAVGYGKTAVATRVAEVPQKKQPKQPPPPPKPPAHILAAKQELLTLYPGNALMSRVVFKEWKKLPSARVRGTTYGAWTNSVTDIYIGDSFRGLNFQDADIAIQLRSIVFHESLHIEQFDRAQGKPPTKYAEMVAYEADAYAKHLAWIRKELAAHAVLADQEKGAARLAALFANTVSRVTQKVKPADREKAYWQFLTDKNTDPQKKSPLLPQHPFGKLADLYLGKL